MDFEKLCDNRTPLRARVVPLDDRHGREVAVAITKLTFEVADNGRVRLAIPQSPVRMIDETVRGGSVRHPSDLTDEKPGTDVLLVGRAYPPPGDPVTSREVRLRVAREDRLIIDKALRVYGPRVYYRSLGAVSPGPPAALSVTPLLYEDTHGGADWTEPSNPVIDWRNPLGIGVVSDPARLEGCPAPRIEDPRAPLSSRRPAPAGFGPIPRSWEPRSKLAGTRDERWQRERAPIAPEDHDPRASSCAPADQWCDPPLEGDESIEVIGVTPFETWRFRLPRFRPELAFWIGGERRRADTHLDTLLIDAEPRCVELTWRASVPVPKRTNMLERVEIRGALPEPLLVDLLERLQEQRAQRDGAGIAS